jgi:hypothetical protein
MNNPRIERDGEQLERPISSGGLWWANDDDDEINIERHYYTMPSSDQNKQSLYYENRTTDINIDHHQSINVPTAKAQAFRIYHT